MKKLIASYLQHYQGFSSTIWIILFAIFINMLGSIITIFLSLYLVTQLNFNVKMIGTVMTCYGIGAMLGSYVSGLLCDRFSELKIATISLYINGIILMLLVFPAQFSSFAMMAILLGLSNSAFTPANRIALMRYSHAKDRFRIGTLRYTVINLGFGAGVFIGGLLSIFGYHVVFIFNGLATLLAATIFYFFLAHRKPDQDISDSNIKNDETIKRHSTFPGHIVLLYITLLFGALIFGQLRTTYPIYLYHHYHLNAHLFSYLFLLSSIVVALFQVPLLHILEKFNQLIITGSGIFFIGFGMFLLPFGHTYSFAVFACLVWTLGEMLFFATVQVLVYEKAKISAKGKAMGTYQSVYTFGTMFGPISGSWIYHYMNDHALWYVCGLFGFISLLIYLAVYFSQLKTN